MVCSLLVVLHPNLVYLHTYLVKKEISLLMKFLQYVLCILLFSCVSHVTLEKEIVVVWMLSGGYSQWMTVSAK